MVAILFSGCTCHKDTVYIEKELPYIQVPKRSNQIDVNVTNGCACGDSLKNIFNGIKALRQNENYCIEQINKYNKEFVNESR